MRSDQLRGGSTTTAKPTQQTSKDRSIGCPGAVRELGELSAGQPRCDEHRRGAEPEMEQQQPSHPFAVAIAGARILPQAGEVFG